VGFKIQAGHLRVLFGIPAKNMSFSGPNESASERYQYFHFARQNLVSRDFSRVQLAIRSLAMAIVPQSMRLSSLRVQGGHFATGGQVRLLNLDKRTVSRTLSESSPASAS
jgi:hypothetical protein